MPRITVKNTSNQPIFLGKKAFEIDSILAPNEKREIDDDLLAWTETGQTVDLVVSEHLQFISMEPTKINVTEIAKEVEAFCSYMLKELNDDLEGKG